VFGSASELWPRQGTPSDITTMDVKNADFGVAFAMRFLSATGGKFKVEVAEVAVEITFMDPTTGTITTVSGQTTPPAGQATTAPVTDASGATVAVGSGGGGVPMAAIIGAAVGGLVLIALVVLVVILAVRHNRNVASSNTYTSLSDEPLVDYQTSTGDATNTTEILGKKFML
jgi:hypothetical protein